MLATAQATLIDAGHRVDHHVPVPPGIAPSMAVGMRAPKTPIELVGALECALATLDIKNKKLQGQSWEPLPPSPHLGQSKGTHHTPYTHLCPTTSPCPPQLSNSPLPQPGNLASWLHHLLSYSTSPHQPSTSVWVEGWPVEAILDSGSTITLVMHAIDPACGSQVQQYHQGHMRAWGCTRGGYHSHQDCR